MLFVPEDLQILLAKNIVFAWPTNEGHTMIYQTPKITKKKKLDYLDL